VEVSIQSVEVSIQSVEVSIQSVEVSIQSVEVSIQGVEVSIPTGYGRGSVGMRRIPGNLRDVQGRPILVAGAVKLRAHVCRSLKTGLSRMIEERYFVKVIVTRDSGTMFYGPQFVSLDDWIDPGKVSLSAYWPPPSRSFPDPVAHSYPGYDVELDDSCVILPREFMDPVPPETTHEDVFLTIGDITRHDAKVRRYDQRLSKLAGKTGEDYETYCRLRKARDRRIKHRLLQAVHCRVQERLSTHHGGNEE